MRKKLIILIFLGILTPSIIWLAATIRTEFCTPTAPPRVLPDESLKSISYSPDGRFFVPSYADTESGVVRVWDARSLMPVRTFNSGVDRMESAVFSPDGKRIIVAGGSRSTICSAETGEIMHSLKTAACYEALFFRKGGSAQIIVSLYGARSRAIALYDMDLGKRIWKRQLGYEVDEIGVSPNGDIAWAAGLDNSYHSHMFVFDPTAGKQIVQASAWLKPYAFAHMCFSHDSRLLAIASPYDKISIWDVGSRRKLTTLSCDQNGMSPIGALTFSSDDRYLAFGGADQERTFFEALALNFHYYGKVWLWDTKSKQTRQLPGYKDGAAQLEFSPDDKQLVCISPFGQGVVFDTSTSLGSK